jgi:hypothetical protein
MTCNPFDMKNDFARRPAAVVMMLLLSLALPCCKKNSGSDSTTSNGSGYYMKFKLNGVQLEYDSQPIASISFSKPDSLYTGVLAAYKDVTPRRSGISPWAPLSTLTGTACCPESLQTPVLP